eukprot:393506-Prymnesium_polylepis.1
MAALTEAEVDQKLFEGAASLGWTITPRGANGAANSNYWYVSPEQRKFKTTAEALAARDVDTR